MALRRVINKDCPEGKGRVEVCGLSGLCEKVINCNKANCPHHFNHIKEGGQADNE